MLSVKNISVMNFENAIRGARNPMNSWARMDSYYDENHNFVFGPNDLDLAKRLCRAGSDHRKFIRQIFVSVDITAPIYWWKEYDTYKIGTVANSTSTMHKIHSKEFTAEDFSGENLTEKSKEMFDMYIAHLEAIRQSYIAEEDSVKKKQLWYDLIKLLPSSYNQMRTCSLNYEVLSNIYYARRNHKLEEWHVLCRWIESLPYAKELIMFRD